jgi:hypothetical protein
VVFFFLVVYICLLDSVGNPWIICEFFYNYYLTVLLAIPLNEKWVKELIVKKRC